MVTKVSAGKTDLSHLVTALLLYSIVLRASATVLPMKTCRSMWALAAGLILSSVLPLFAQQFPAADKGFFFTEYFSESHDSSLGWSTELASGVGYDASKHVFVSIGVPLYLVQPYTVANSQGQTVNSAYNAVGDAAFAVNYKAGGLAQYAMTTTVTAPTGDTTNGLSTGRATFDLDNHVEHNWSRFTPYAEFGIANSNTTFQQSHGIGHGHATQSYTTLGGLTHFRGGSSIDLFRSVSFQFSGYDELPFGNQKVYSRLLPRGSNGLSHRKNPSVFELASVTAGTASIAEDDGFEAEISSNPSPRIEAALTFTRSLHNSINEVAFSMGYRFGHVGSEHPSK